MARSGDAAGRHAARVEVQRGSVDTRLSGRVRGQGGKVHTGRAERVPGCRGQLGTVAEPVRHRQWRVHQERSVGPEHAAVHRQVAAHVPEDPIQ